MGIALAIAIAAIAALSFLLFRGAQRLLQFDELFQRVSDTLEGYGDDLTRMTSADIDGILADHPEVRMFHMRNMNALRDIRLVLEDITKVTPRRRKAPALPRPDME